LRGIGIEERVQGTCFVVVTERRGGKKKVLYGGVQTKRRVLVFIDKYGTDREKGRIWERKDGISTTPLY